MAHSPFRIRRTAFVALHSPTSVRTRRRTTFSVYILVDGGVPTILHISVPVSVRRVPVGIPASVPVDAPVGVSVDAPISVSAGVLADAPVQSATLCASGCPLAYLSASFWVHSPAYPTTLPPQRKWAGRGSAPPHYPQNLALIQSCTRRSFRQQNQSLSGVKIKKSKISYVTLRAHLECKIYFVKTIARDASSPLIHTYLRMPIISLD